MPGDGRGPGLAQVGQCLWALLAAFLGGVLTVVLFSARDGVIERTPRAIDEAPPCPSRWLRPAVVGLVAVAVLGAIATAVTGDPLWSGLTFTTTCAFQGLAILGMILGAGRRRTAWLGAALFGVGYMALVFGRPVDQPSWTALTMTPVLEGLRSRLVPLTQGGLTPSARLQLALDRPIPMSFPDETPLGVVLAHIKGETSSPPYPGIQIYVDPIGLQEAERSMDSTVQMDLEGIPLRTTLWVCLKQLGLVYQVKDGYLRITSEDEGVTRTFDDPFLLVGHCLLALISAGAGAMAAPIVAGAGVQKPS